MSNPTAEPLTQSQVAALAGISVQAISKAAKEQSDPPPKEGRTYPCRQIGEWLRRRHLRGVGLSQDGETYDIDSEKARLTHHQANIAALEEQIKRKNLLPADRVKEKWVEMKSAARARLLSLPSSLASAAYGRDPAEIERIATKLVHETLEELARGDGVA